MSESSLSIGLPELKKFVGFQLGYGRGVDIAWSASQVLDILEKVQSGVRQVYFPPSMSGQGAYEWSWMRPTTTMVTAADDGNYDLPDDFGRLIGTLYYAADIHRDSISIVPVGRVLANRASSDLNGYPYCAAIRYKASTGATGQRQEILFYPEPDAAYTLSYEYEAYTGVLSDAYPYPLGGMQLAELYIESCLAICESRADDNIGLHTQQFQILLADAISRDRKRGAQRYGNMGHKDCECEEFRRGWQGSVYPMTYNGVVI